MKKTHALHWFGNDLRLHDNPALVQHINHTEQLSCVFVIDPAWFETNELGHTSMGPHRWRFLQQSLIDLHNNLSKLGQRLIVLTGDPVEQLFDFITRYLVDTVSSTAHPGVYEQRQWQKLRQRCTNTAFNQSAGFTLFEQGDMPFLVQDMPDTFSPFRRKIEKSTSPVKPVDPPSALPLPHPATAEYSLTFSVEACNTRWQGGETAAMQQLKYYLFDTDLIASYKETRNGLEGWDYSSKLSAWLANGSLSARYASAQLCQYEQQRTANESTYWLYFELLWREFFQWQLFKYAERMFAYSGIKDQPPNTTHHPKWHQRWCNAETDCELVNAAMNQLNATGYMSNRARQWVASYYVNSMKLDWRYAAAFFEQMLIDYDVAANWGNWQYLAGVGSDPRGLREFNLTKQAQMYDPEGTFVAHWSK